MKSFASYSGFSGQVKEKPSFVDSMGFIESGKTDYLTYYDFAMCPMDVSRYPFSVHLGAYQISRTARGLEDAPPILYDILGNVYRQVAIVGAIEADAILQNTKQLMKSLFECFTGECRRQFNDDFGEVLQRAKWWTMHTSRCLNDVYSVEVLPGANSPSPECGFTNHRVDAWQRTNSFRETMIDYCIYLTVEYALHSPCSPYKDVHGIVPFNYYGDDYERVVSAAQKKKLKTDSDRVATDYLTNVMRFRPYLESRLAVLDGKEMDDPVAVEERNRIAKDLIEMANSYLLHIEEAGVTAPAIQKYAIELWDWIASRTMEIMIESDLSWNHCCFLPSELSSEENTRVINNTSAQYSSFRKTFNRQFVKSKAEFIGGMAEADTQTGLDDEEPIEEIIDEIPTPGPKKGKPRKSFEECVIKTGDSDSLIKILHTMLDGKSGKDVYQVLYAAMKRGLITKPSYRAIMNEFSISGSESGYNDYFAKYPLSDDKIDPIVDRIKQEMKDLK